MSKIFRKPSFAPTSLFIATLILVPVVSLLAQHEQHKGIKSLSTLTSTGHQVKAPTSGPNVVGQWTTLPTSLNGVVAIHSALLHTGYVISYWYPLGVATQSPYSLYNTTTHAVTNSVIPFNADIFCGGLTIMADGRLLTTGGLNGNPYPHVPDDGTQTVGIFDPVSQTWSQGPNMNYWRWYPTNVELPSGDVLTLTGKNAMGNAITTQMEQYDPTANTWTVLPSTANIQATSDTYLKMKVMPSGNIFKAGSDKLTTLFHPSSNTWTNVGNTNDGPRYHGAAVLLPGTSKAPLTSVLVAGGTENFAGGDPLATAEVINLNVAQPAWSYVAPMNNARYNANLVILADGTLLTVGGAQLQKYDSPVFIPELYNVTANTWTAMAEQAADRPYHSTALLLPDGTVWSAGSDNPASTDTDVDYEIFSPPYLYNSAGQPATRPVISSVPTTPIAYNTKFSIKTPDASTIASVALVRPAATTHDNDMDERYVPLVFNIQTGAITAQTPKSANYAPPGYYMVVIVNTSGVPSVMPFVQICPTSGCN
jgi:hypothetical protein